MDTIERIKNNFTTHLETANKALETLVEPIDKAAAILVQSLRDHNKILSCGNGGSACDSLHFAAEMLNRFRFDRPSIPAIALNADVATITAIANDSSYENVFAKQVASLGRNDDVLLAISTSGNSQNIVSAIYEARSNDMKIVALTGNDGGEVAELIRPQDVEIRVPSNVTARIQEMHILVIHCLCELIESGLYYKLESFQV